MIRLKVVAVSQTTNSFGLRGMILISDNGQAFEAAANSLNVRPVGTVFNLPDGDIMMNLPSGFEIPCRFANPSRALVDAAFAETVDVREGRYIDA